jgi:hypothetical protein
MPKVHEIEAAETRIGPREQRRAGWILPSLLVLALIAAVAAVVLVIRSGDDPIEAGDVLADITAGIEAIEGNEYGDLTPSTDSTDIAFLDWLLGIGAEPEILGCEAPVVPVVVSCDANLGPDNFFAQVTGEDPSSALRARINDDGTYEITSWPPPPGIEAIEGEFVRWVKEAHPGDVPLLFGVWTFTEASSELHMQYVDEFIEARTG